MFTLTIDYGVFLTLYASPAFIPVVPEKLLWGARRKQSLRPAISAEAANFDSRFHRQAFALIKDPNTVRIAVSLGLNIEDIFAFLR